MHLIILSIILFNITILTITILNTIILIRREGFLFLFLWFAASYVFWISGSMLSCVFDFLLL
jgi:hypothetical protein